MTDDNRIFRSGLGLGLMLLMAAACRADDNSPKPDSSLEIVQYKAPVGWKESDQPGAKATARVFVAPDSNASEQAMILILVYPAQEGLDLSAAFDAAAKDITSDGKVLESSDVTATKTRQGFDALSRTLVKEAAGAQHVYARMIAAKVQNRMAGIYYLANTKERYDLHQPDMDALLKSVSFNASAGAPANAMAANAEIDALEKQKQELLKKVADIEARQRQLAAAVPGGAPPATDEQLLLKAKERFAKEIGGRRKAHTILGNILGPDGKPIPDVETYRVFVWGTTIAAETTHYGLEVDANGHFEQQVPDGLYQIKATCIVKNGGHRMPVDLVWLDGKKLGIDEASAGGIVKDYCLAVGGLKPGENPKDAHSYFGGAITVNGPPYTATQGSFSTRHPGATVQLTMTPLGPVVDGSRRDPFTIDIAVADLDYGTHPGSIPLGAYRVTATIVGKDGVKQAMQCSLAFDGQYGDSADAFWECARSDQELRADPTVYLKE
ncbi:MAG: hypothetical protein JWL69_621 [Phycisphaerales bacterium]|nr:hypothetical protein [Phycisphaerales bacterium]MDB5356138.1 hypothetical protein [Phycisphaerales bacterium]